MKTFNNEKFCSDLIKLRKNSTQVNIADKLGINRSTLSLLESGKQIPSLDIFNAVCNLGNYEPNDYFLENNDDALIYLMGKLEESDKEKIYGMIENIQIKEKYIMLSRRCQ
ncbi:MAG: helix-turn-helix domain-containing protein [Sedimentibacter sp.]